MYIIITHVNVREEYKTKEKTSNKRNKTKNVYKIRYLRKEIHYRDFIVSHSLNRKYINTIS